MRGKLAKEIRRLVANDPSLRGKTEAYLNQLCKKIKKVVVEHGAKNLNK